MNYIVVSLSRTPHLILNNAVYAIVFLIGVPIALVNKRYA